MYSSEVPLVSCPSVLSECLTPRMHPAGIKAGAISSSASHLCLAIFKSEVAVNEVNSECTIEEGRVKHGGVFSVESTDHAGAYLSH